MRVRAFIIFLAITTAAVSAQNRPHDAALTDITIPQTQYQVMTPEQAERLYTEQQSLSDLKEKVDGIDKDVTEIKGNVQILMQRDAVVNFIAHCCEILFPGLLIAAFGIWLGKNWDGKVGKAKSAA